MNIRRGTSTYSPGGMFRHKLILCFIIIMSIPTVMITSAVFISSRSIIAEQMLELTAKNFHSVKLAIQNRLFYMAELGAFAYTDPDILSVLASDVSDDMAENIIKTHTLERAIKGYVRFFSPAINQDLDYFPVTSKLYLKDRPELVPNNIYSPIFDLCSLESEYWYHDMPDRSRIIFVDTNIQRLIILRKIYDLRNVDAPRFTALFALETPVFYFNNFLRSANAIKDARTFILNEYGTIVLSSDGISTEENELILKIEHDGDSFSKQKINKRESVVISEKLSGFGWTLVSINYTDSINLHERVFTAVVILILLLCYAISVLTAVFLSRAVSKPIVSLVDSMSRVGDNNFEIMIDYNKNDEFGYLITHYNNMLSQIRELIDKLYVSEMNKQKAEIDAKNAELEVLQSQINPHFLYNTLDSINLYAIQHDVPVICEMIEALADFFRYTLNSGSPVITLHDEIAFTKNYLKLQAMRMGKDLQYSVSVPQDLLNERICKLVIQPLTENSIVHGFNGKTLPLRIDISAIKSGGNVIITISDNGNGADIEELKQRLNEKTPSSNESAVNDKKIKRHFNAVNNVHKRLQNTFGGGYGLDFRSNESGGLLVDIIIPADKQENDNVY
jgi:two-component system sensor histidine kinase YesM